jgi:hypothetical protein
VVAAEVEVVVAAEVEEVVVVVSAAPAPARWCNPVPTWSGSPSAAKR